jgi:hypothetical protein
MDFINAHFRRLNQEMVHENVKPEKLQNGRKESTRRIPPFAENSVCGALVEHGSHSPSPSLLSPQQTNGSSMTMVITRRKAEEATDVIKQTKFNTIHLFLLLLSFTQ